MITTKLIIFAGYYLRTYADIPHYEFGLPTLDFLRIRPRTKTRGCILRTYADIPNNHLSSNAGLFAQANRCIGVFCVRTQIFLIMILIVQR